MRTWLQDWLVVVAMVAAIVATLVPLAWFHEEDAIDAKADDSPPRAWLGLVLGLTLALPIMVLFDMIMLETQQSSLLGSGTSVFLGVTMLGVGIGGAISGWCAAVTGGRWINGRIYDFHHPVRGRFVGLVRAALGVLVLGLVVVAVS